MKCPSCNGTGEVNPTSLVEYLRLRMGQDKLSSRAVAKRTGLSNSTISRLLNGIGRLDITSWAAVAAWLNLDSDTIAQAVLAEMAET